MARRAPLGARFGIVVMFLALWTMLVLSTAGAIDQVAPADSLSAQAAAAGEAHTDVFFLDQFNNVSFSGNDGADRFSGPWREKGENDGPASGGVIWVHSSNCSGNCLKLGGSGQTLDGSRVAREVDIEGAVEMELCFDYNREWLGGGNGGFALVVSRDGGAFKTLAKYEVEETDDGWRKEIIDITDYASANTQIGFIGWGSASGYLRIDNFEVKGTVVAAPTTTTSKPPATTSTTKPTTNTTRQATTTTTTTAVPPTSSSTSTTDLVGTTTRATTATTTTTVPPPPTTSAPGGAEPPSQHDVMVENLRYMGKAEMAMAAMDPPSNSAQDRARIVAAATPIEHANSSVSIAATTLKTNAVASFILGVLIAFLALRGLSRLDDEI